MAISSGSAGNISCLVRRWKAKQLDICLGQALQQDLGYIDDQCGFCQPIDLGNIFLNSAAMKLTMSQNYLNHSSNTSEYSPPHWVLQDGIKWSSPSWVLMQPGSREGPLPLPLLSPYPANMRKKKKKETLVSPLPLYFNPPHPNPWPTWAYILLYVWNYVNKNQLKKMLSVSWEIKSHIPPQKHKVLTIQGVCLFVLLLLGLMNKNHLIQFSDSNLCR